MKKKLKISRERLLFAGGIALLLLASLTIGVFVQLLQRNSPPSTIVSQKKSPESVSAAQDLRLQGKPEEAGKKIEEALQKADVPDEERYMLYIQQGVGLSEQKKFPEAIAAYENAVKIKETFEAVNLIASTWDQIGDTAKAIEFYKKAVPLLSKSNPAYEDEKAAVEMRIAELEGRP